MFTYLTLNLAFMAVVVAVLWYFKLLRWDRMMGWLLVILLVLTALFDSLIVSTEIVAYDPTKLLGIYIGAAPIEDFMYSLLVVLLVPNLWKKMEAPRAQ